MKRVYLVTGPGRSGTSLLVGLFEAMGVQVSTRLKPADAYNRKGYFEDERVVELHRNLLGHVGAEGTFGAMTPPPEYLKTADIYRDTLDELVRHVAHELGSGESMVIKDPRISVLFPLWIEVARRLGIELAPVLSLRHPLEVAESISKISKVPITVGYAIWMNRVCHFLRDAPAPFAIFHYENLLRDPVTAVEKLAGFLARDPAEAERLARLALDAGVIDPSLRSSPNDPRRGQNAAVLKLYEQLASIVGTCEAPDELRGATTKYFQQCGAMRGWAAGINQLQKQVRADRSAVRKRDEAQE